MTSFTEDHRKGYADQTAWLRGASIPAAEQALTARRATQEANDYNAGATAATADYIARMRAYVTRAREIADQVSS